MALDPDPIEAAKVTKKSLKKGQQGQAPIAAASPVAPSLEPEKADP